MTTFHKHIKSNGSGALEVEGITVTDLATEYGTPLFVLSENMIRENFRRIHRAFADVYPAEVIICAGMKGNWGLAARRVIVEEGGGGDAFGLGELTVAMLAGSDPRKIVMNGANKSRETIEAAIDMGVLNQVDNADELQLVEAVAGALGKTARISLRIRLPLKSLAEVNYVDARYPEGISPSYWERTFKFGLAPDAYAAAVKIAQGMKHVSLEGCHYHGGIPRRAGFFREETEELVEILGDIKAQTGWAPAYLNIGGGFVSERYGADAPPSVEEYGRVIGKAIVDTCAKHGMDVPVLMMEPGRYCWESAGLWVVQVNARKEDHTRAKSFEDYHHMFATHLPGEERPAGRPVRQSALHDIMAAQGCQFMEGGGYERPKFFSPEGKPETPGFRRNETFALVAEECRAMRERVGLADLSSFAKYDVTGPGAEGFLNRILANKLPVRDGGIVLGHLLTDAGRIETEFTVTRLAADRWYLLSSISAEIRDWDHLNSLKHPDEDVTICNVTDEIGVLVVAGPRSRAVLQPLTPASLGNEAFRWLSAQEIAVAGVPLRAMRVNYVGELGWELHAPKAKLVALYQAIRHAARPHGGANVGLYAINSMRMEKGYRGWGAELTNEITLIEADMARFFVPAKGTFLGRDATTVRQGRPLETCLVYLELSAPDDLPLDNDARGGEAVLSDGRRIGVVTSGGYGHYTGRSLAFGYVEPALAASGTTLTVDLLGRMVTATVLAAPVHDPDNTRPRA
jgi:glycine cleavage system aminomethyltransferase T/diaminopimelate decarboxylase